MPNIRPLIMPLALVTVLLASAPGIAQDRDKNNGCTIHPPKGWEQQKIQWIGGCKNSYADGLGVLKRFEDGKVTENYYGEARDGALTLGVIDSGTGYLAGRFRNGSLEHSDDRNVTLNALKSASKAAQELSDLYRRDGNKMDAQYYKEQSEKLANQMD